MEKGYGTRRCRVSDGLKEKKKNKETKRDQVFLRGYTMFYTGSESMGVYWVWLLFVFCLFALLFL